MQLELDRTVSLTLQSRELDDCPAAKLAIRSLIMKMYIQYQGKARAKSSKMAVAPRDINLSDLSDKLDLDGRLSAMEDMLEQYQVGCLLALECCQNQQNTRV